MIISKTQKDVQAVQAYGESDFAGEVEMRKPTSGGLCCLRSHTVKSWACTQPIIALSTGQAELYAMNEEPDQALGLQSLLRDLGIELEIRVHTDATTGRAMGTRRGLGKVHHIEVNELWLQEKVEKGKLNILKINKNKFNLTDLLTKYLSKDEIEHIVDFMQHAFLEGRSDVAPELSLLDDNSSGIVREWHELACHEKRASGVGNPY